MRLIQTFDTSDGENFKMGFPTKLACRKYLEKSFEIHKKNYEVFIYADKAGCEYLKTFLPAENIVEIEFSRPDARFWNSSKLDVQLLQTEPSIHCDIDATIFELVEFDGVLTEMYRYGMEMNESRKVGLVPVARMLCSGIIGFSDMNFRNEYCNKALTLIKDWPLRLVTGQSLWTVEEILLTNLVDDNNMNVTEMPIGSFEHLQGGMKK